ncbi:purine-rich negative regulatory element binding [Porites harrisoni]
MQPKVSKCVNRVWKQAAYLIPPMRPEEKWVDRQHVEASDRPTGQGSDSSPVTHYKNIVHLWEFLLELLADESCRSIITWSNENRMEFKIKVPDEVAKRWGQFKRTRTMTYDKLSRALRFYYSKGIIQKVSSIEPSIVTTPNDMPRFFRFQMYVVL